MNKFIIKLCICLVAIFIVDCVKTFTPIDFFVFIMGGITFLAHATIDDYYKNKLYENEL